MIQISEVRLDQALSHGLEALAFDHWEEVGPFKGQMPFDPDWDLYRAIERAGAFRMVGAFGASSLLVGYTTFVVGPDPWSKRRLRAIHDEIYVAPEHRGMVSYRLLAESEKLLKTWGAARVSYQPPVGSILCDLLERLGYKHIENGYAKVV